MLRGTIVLIGVITALNLMDSNNHVVQYLDNGDIKTEILKNSHELDSLVTELENSNIKY